MRDVEEKLKRDHVLLTPNESDPFLNSLKSYVGLYDYKPNDNQSQRELKSHFDLETGKFRNSGNFLNDDYVFDVQKLAKDLNESQKNFVVKKQRWTQIWSDYLKNKDELQQCQYKMDEARIKYDETKQLIADKERLILGINERIQAL